MIKLSIVDGYLIFNGVQTHSSVCRSFRTWFAEHFREVGDFKEVYNQIDSPQWLCFFLADWELFGEQAELGYIYDQAFGPDGLDWGYHTNDKPACDLIRKAMPYQLVLALMEDNGFDFGKVEE